MVPSNHTINISQLNKQYQSSESSNPILQGLPNPKPNLSLERPIISNDLGKNNIIVLIILVFQSPVLSDNSSINSSNMDQTLRLRIGGSLPKGLMSQSNSSKGPPLLHLNIGSSQGSNGIHPTHFYQ
jgi:hypothetical protein